MSKRELKELLKTSIKELKFANMQKSMLLNSLREVKKISNDVLVNTVIDNTEERYELDKLIHAKLLFKINE